MHYSVIIVTRNKSSSVRTLHTILNIISIILYTKQTVEFDFVNDNVFDINGTIKKKLKKSDRIIFIDYSVSLTNSLTQYILTTDIPKEYDAMVLPSVKEGIDWEMFKTKIENNSKEPINQLGLNFDTEVDKKIEDGIWTVKNTNPKCFILKSKNTTKKLKENKGDGIKLPIVISDIFNQLKTCAYTKSEVVLSYSHECVGNLLQAAGVNSVN